LESFLQYSANKLAKLYCIGIIETPKESEVEKIAYSFGEEERYRKRSKNIGSGLFLPPK